MLIVKIIKEGRTTYYGCASIKAEQLGDTPEERRIVMLSTSGIKRLAFLKAGDSVELLNDIVFL